ncbi:MAG: hypothetical protein V3S14_16720 [Anaerolineae bacterium]
MTRFNHSDLAAKQVTGRDGHLMVQITSRDRRKWGAARTALSVGIAPVAGGERCSTLVHSCGASTISPVTWGN